MGMIQDLFGGGNYNTVSGGFYDSGYEWIDKYSKDLDSITDGLNAAIQNMYSTAYTFGMQNKAAQYGAAGFNLNGGAYASEAARASVSAQSQMIPQIYKQRLENTDKVFKAKMGFLGNQMDAYDTQNSFTTRQNISGSNNLGLAAGSAAGALALAW